jgi:hypothetical protein
MNQNSSNSSRIHRRKIAGTRGEIAFYISQPVEKFKFRAWYDYLRISTSYNLAKKVANKNKLTDSEKSLIPPYFDLVLEAYQKYGDVWVNSFDEWQFKRDSLDSMQALHLPKTICYLDGDDLEEQKKKARKELDRFIEEIWKKKNKVPTYIAAFSFENSSTAIKDYHWEMAGVKSGDYVIASKLDSIRLNKNSGLMILQKNRMRYRNLQILKKLVLLKARKPQLKTWQLAEQLKISMENVQKIINYENELKLVDKKKIKYDVTAEKLIINAIIGRHLRNAFLISENAAMGKFPTLDNDEVDLSKVKTYFNFEEIRREIKLLNIRRKEEVKLTPQHSVFGHR